MVLFVPCRECQKEVSLFSKQCHHCGLYKAYLDEEETLLMKLTPLISLVGLVVLFAMIFW